MAKKQGKEYYWHKLDNAAKVFPAVRSSSNSSVFRITAKLREPVDPDTLRRAVDRALGELPTFNVKLRRGLFWYYWESNDLRVPIREDDAYPLRGIDKRLNSGFMFRVNYLGRKINLEMFHALTDGSGAAALLKSILYFYLKEKHPDQITRNERIAESGFSQHALDEDSFLRIKKDAGAKARHPRLEPAYQVHGAHYIGGRIDVTQGILPTHQVVALAKAEGVTLTAYLAALMMYAIYQTNYRFYPEEKPIVFSIPVNLRNVFRSSTLRNFFSFITVSIPFSSKEDWTFSEVAQSIARQLKEATSRESLMERLAYNLSAERSLAVRFVPLFLKNWSLKLIYMREEKSYTSTMSNLGRVQLPAEQVPYVERIEALNNITKRQCFKACMCSYEDELVFSFVSGIEDKDVERYFFRFLAERGVNVKIASNEVEADEIL